MYIESSFLKRDAMPCLKVSDVHVGQHFCRSHVRKKVESCGVICIAFALLDELSSAGRGRNQSGLEEHMVQLCRAGQ